MRKVLFPMGKSGLWLNNAYVILSSAGNIEKALSDMKKHRTGTRTINGKYLEVFECP